MIKQVFDAVLTGSYINEPQQRRFQPFAQKPSAHSGFRLVQYLEERSLPSAVTHVLRNFQMTQARSVDEHLFFTGKRVQYRNM